LYNDDDNWSWPSNKQEQQEQQETFIGYDFSYEASDNYDNDSYDNGYSDDYGDNDYK
jgi:hypothetical protein